MLFGRKDLSAEGDHNEEKKKKVIKEVLSIRIGGREKKKKIRTILFNLVQFRNLLIILITKYKDLYEKYPLNQSILYGLVAKSYAGKYQEEFEIVLQNITQNSELKDFLEKLKSQKEKVDNSHFIQYTIRQTIKDFINFSKALMSYKENPEKFTGIPKPPKAKKLRYLINFSVEANANSFKQKDNKLIIRLRKNKYLKVKLPKEFSHRVSSIRVKFFGNDLYVDIVYEKELIVKESIGKYKAGIDIGLNEMLSVVSENPELKSFIISGKEIKAFNQWFNKEREKIRSEIDYLKKKINSNSYKKEDMISFERILKNLEIKEKTLSSYRKRWLDNNFHKLSRKLLDLLYKMGHKVLYIGKNALENKDGINLSKQTNQDFVSIPFRRLLELIKYKAKEYGIHVIEVDESYTSKTSPFANLIEVQKTKNEELCQGEKNKNIFKDMVLNKIFHTDLVGALNIIRAGTKLLRLNFYENLKVLLVKLCNPARFKLVDFLYKVSPESLWIGSSK